MADSLGTLAAGPLPCRTAWVCLICTQVMQGTMNRVASTSVLVAVTPDCSPAGPLLPSMPLGMMYCTQVLLVVTSWHINALTSFKIASSASCRPSWMQTLSAPSWLSCGGHLASRWAGPWCGIGGAARLHASSCVKLRCMSSF